MVIGIASVTIMVSVGESAQKWIKDSLNATLGTNVLFLLPSTEEESSTLSPSSFLATLQESDYDIFVKDKIEGVQAHSRRDMDVAELEYKNSSIDTLLFVHDVGYAKAFQIEFIAGRNFNQKDADTRRKCIVIDDLVQEKLFPLQDPIAKEVQVNGKDFEIIGVIKDPSQTQGQSGDTTASIFMLLDTYSHVFNEPIEYDAVVFRVEESTDKEAVKKEVIRKLKLHRGVELTDEPDFSVQSQEDFLETSSSITDMITTFLTVIASISLIVAGIGVMNIMLVSVNERIKEIGLRKAIGAKNRDILIQFMIESIIYSLIGGIIGLFLGSGVAIIIERIAKLPELISVTAVISSMLVSILIGTIFGIYPAQRAAKLSPIEALRSD